MRQVTYLWTAAGLAQSADIATTIISLREHGTFEANPAVAAAIDLLGAVPGLVALHALVFLAAGLVWEWARQAGLPVWPVPAILAVGGAIPAAANAAQLAGVIL